MSVITNSFNTFWQSLARLIYGQDTLTIPVSSWASWSDKLEAELEENEDAELEESDFPYYADIAVSGITSNDVIAFTLDADCYDTAAAAALYSYPETSDGIVRFRAMSVPQAVITGEYYISKKINI